LAVGSYPYSSVLTLSYFINRELRSTSKKLTEANEALDTMRKDKMKYRMQRDKVSKDLSELQHVYEISRLNGKIRSSSPEPVCITKLYQTTKLTIICGASRFYKIDFTGVISGF